jgi:hypothetical protein
VAFIYAGFGLTIFFARRAPTSRLRTAASDKPRLIRIKKVFTFGNINIPHLTPQTQSGQNHFSR